MKKLVLLSIVLGLAVIPAFAKREETITLKVGQQRTTTAGKLTVRFAAVDSDSRCPINAICIWAGNARVKISVSKGRKRATSFELNSMLDPKVVTYEGYDIRFVDLTPRPGAEEAGDSSNKSRKGKPSLTLSITKQE